MAFPEEELEYNPFMPAINFINCKKEGANKVFAFAPSIFSKSSIVGNMSVFENLNVKQMGIEKTDPIGVTGLPFGGVI